MKSAEETRKIIASRLMLARQQAGLSQAQAAKLLQISRPAVTEMEAGRRKVSAEELVNFSDIYDVGIEWLSGKDAEGADMIRDKLQLAARDIAKMNPDDLERVHRHADALGRPARQEQRRQGQPG